MMALAHHHSRAVHEAAQRQRTEEQGYVLVMFALLLVPLLLMAGLAVDVGSWYNRASDMQKAADAAALAGVVWLPDLTTATSAAREAAARNGFPHGVDGITVSVEAVTEQRIRVAINDPEVGSPLVGNLGIKDLDMTRRALADYVLAVPMGSPRNFFGTGSLDTGYNERLWLSINTWCTDKVDGDRYQSPFEGNRPYGTDSSRCPTSYSGSYLNPEYRSRGHEYYIEIPNNRSGNVEVLLHDPGYRTGNSGDVDLRLYTGAHNFIYRLYAPDNTPLNDSDNPLVSGCSATYTSSTSFLSLNYLGTNRWNRLCTITTAMPTGRYILRVTNTAGSRYAAGANNFSVVAKYTSASYTASSSLCDARTVTSCPRVFGKEAMSVFADQSSSTADFFLAEISPIHTGKRLIVELYDPGEGGNNIRVRRPTGTNSWTDATFRWSADNGTSGGPTTSLDVTGSRFNGRTVRIEIDLTGYNPPSNNAWWQIRYNFGSGDVTDRTTWSARVQGDPVHLVEE